MLWNISNIMNDLNITTTSISQFKINNLQTLKLENYISFRSYSKLQLYTDDPDLVWIAILKKAWRIFQRREVLSCRELTLLHILPYKCSRGQLLLQLSSSFIKITYFYKRRRRKLVLQTKKRLHEKFTNFHRSFFLLHSPI
jgi:hypothetical protein